MFTKFGRTKQNNCISGRKAPRLKFTAEQQLGLVGIKSPLVENARNQVMAEPTLAYNNPSARIKKGDNVCVSVLAPRCSPVRMISAASSTNVLSGATSIGAVGKLCESTVVE